MILTEPLSRTDHEAYVADPLTQKALGQFPTPVWFAEALVERYFPRLGAQDQIVEPSCGPGSFLMALPEDVPAIGVEIDPRTAAIARINTGRTIIEGDFTTAAIDVRPTLIIGNPPFNLSIIDGFLKRAYELLEDGGQVGLILPTYAFQTADRVARYADTWSLAQEMIPRNIYPGLSLPLLFATFRKERVRTLVGFALYRETADMLTLKKPYREMINGVGKSVWKATIAKALTALGGKANVEAICAEIESNKPTRTRWWREQIRKVLRQAKTLFKAEGNGWYTFA
jgi:predicted RNA methylase